MNIKHEMLPNIYLLDFTNDKSLLLLLLSKIVDYMTIEDSSIMYH